MTEAQIKAIIDENIRTNGREEITGAIANNVLNAMIDYTTTVVTPTIDVSGAIAVGQVSTAVNGDKIARYLPTKSITKFDSAYAGLVGGYSQGNIVIYNDEIYVSESNNNLTTPSSSSMTWRKLSSGGGGGDIPEATTTVFGKIKYDGVTIKKNSNGQLYTEGGNNVDVDGTTITKNSSNVISVNPSIVGNVNKGVEAYGWGNHALAGYVTSADISNKVDKVIPAKLSYALITPSGAISTAIPSLGIPIKVMGVDATNTPISAETIVYSAYSTEVTVPSAADLDLFNAQEVHFPNLGIMCKKLGNRWYQFEGIEIF